MVDEAVAKMLFDQALELVIVSDAKGKVTYMNKMAQENLGYEAECPDVLLSEIFPSDIVLEDKKLKIDFPLDKTHQFMMYRQNRTCFKTEVKLSEIEEGRFLCMALDISEKNYLEKKVSQSDQEAEEALQVKTQFVANVTHELRTPVNGILGNTKELLSKERDSEKLATLRLIERGCNDMHTIINNILDFSKLDSGKFVLETAPFNFREMMDYIRATHINKITEKGLQLQINISPEIPEEIIGDELRLQQILNNFLSNATKFTYTGKIAVEVLKTAQIGNRIELFFMVIDTGIGIAKEDQDKLFQSFTQVEASTTRKYGGTGLGLSITKQLVELMNGSVHLESEKGKGSMFSFHIWVEIPMDENVPMDDTLRSFDVTVPHLDSTGETELMLTYGTKENREELKKKLSKLILCVDMDNWEKAEVFMESIRQLTQEAPREIKSAALRLKMAVQKADADKTSDAFDKMNKLLKSEE